MRTILSAHAAIRPVAAIVLGVAALSFSACSSRTPTTPTGLTVVQPPLPGAGSGVSGPSSAVLTMSGVSVTVGGNADQPGTFYLNERFTLAETGGRSGATVQEIWSSVAGGESFETTAECWRTPIRVAPGSTTEAFDVGWQDLSYCAPFAVGRVLASVTIRVSYTDDAGRLGSVETTTVVPR